jgi:hypothetical protein
LEATANTLRSARNRAASLMPTWFSTLLSTLLSTSLPPLLLALLLSLLLAGCAAPVQQPEQAEARIEVPAAAARKVVLVVVGSDLAAASRDWEALRGEWRGAMSAAASAAGIDFEWRDGLVNLPRSPATVAVVKVNDYRYLSTGARYGLGALAGNAFIDTSVSFREAPSGRVLGGRKYSTSSTAWQGVFSAMTSKQVQAICDEIVAEIRN